jgi:hypothetical protein
MNRNILSATIAEGNQLSFEPGVNILWGDVAEGMLWELASIFSGCKTERMVTARIAWRSGVCYQVTNVGGAVAIEGVEGAVVTPNMAMRFHKQRFRERRDYACILDGGLPKRSPSMGESDLRLMQFDTFLRGLRKEDDHPLFLCNLLERLDEAVDLHPIFEALNTTGRQVFIAVPHYYKLKTLEEMPYDATIHPL